MAAVQTPTPRGVLFIAGDAAHLAADGSKRAPTSNGGLIEYVLVVVGGMYDDPEGELTVADRFCSMMSIDVGSNGFGSDDVAGQ